MADFIKLNGTAVRTTGMGTSGNSQLEFAYPRSDRFGHAIRWDSTSCERLHETRRNTPVFVLGS